MTNRTEILKAMVAQNPADAFARYGLAMELVNSGQLKSAVDEFRALLEHNPNYAAAYFHGGQVLEKLGDLEQAVTVGTAALDCGRVVWPTMVLAGKLDQTLARQFPRAASAADFRARYLDAGARLALPASRLQRDEVPG